MAFRGNPSCAGVIARRLASPACGTDHAPFGGTDMEVAPDRRDTDVSSGGAGARAKQGEAGAAR